MSAVERPRYTFEEFVARESTAKYKSEFYQGQIFAMVGGSPRHNTISGNIFSSLRNRLRGSSYRPYNGDQRIRILANGLATYPDVSVVCGEPILDAVDRNAITNPRIVIEVLSSSTESYDRGKKSELYRQIESLQEYILVAQDEAHIERFVRHEGGAWILTVSKGMDARLQFQSIPCELTLSEIYEDIIFRSDDDFAPSDGLI